MPSAAPPTLELLGPTLGVSTRTWNAACAEAYGTAEGEILIDGFATPAINWRDLRFQADPAFGPDKMELWAKIPVEHDGWVRAHNAIRHELTQFKRALDGLGEQPLCDWQVSAIKAYVTGHLVHIHEHHSNEDKVFNPAIRKRVVYPEKLEADHVQLVQMMDEIERMGKAVIVGEPVSALARLWTEYEAMMLPHLHEEETVGLPLARAYFTPQEIGKIVESFMKDGDPVSMGGFVHVMGSKKVALGFMAEAGIPSFVWHIPGKGFKALRTLYRKKMQSHVDSLLAGHVVSSVRKEKAAAKPSKGATAAAKAGDSENLAPASIGAAALLGSSIHVASVPQQLSSPVKRMDVQVLSAR